MIIIFFCICMLFTPVYAQDAGPQDATLSSDQLLSWDELFTSASQKESVIQPIAQSTRAPGTIDTTGQSIVMRGLVAQREKIDEEIQNIRGAIAKIDADITAENILQQTTTGATGMGITLSLDSTAKALQREKMKLEIKLKEQQRALRESSLQIQRQHEKERAEAKELFIQQTALQGKLAKTETERLLAATQFAERQSSEGYLAKLRLDAQVAEQNTTAEAHKATAAQYNATSATATANAQAKAANERTRQVGLAVGVGGGTALAITAAFIIYKMWAKRRPRIIEKDDTSIGNNNFPPSDLEKQILSKKLQPLVEEAFEMYGKNCASGLPIRNFLFFGPPGTGKTSTAVAFVRKLSELGLADHIIVRGASFKMLKTAGEASAALRQIIRFAKSSSRPTCIVFDEPEELFCDPSLPQATEKTRSLTTDMRSFFPKTSNKKIAFFLCTNYPNLIDKPIMNRISRASRLEFLPPDLPAVNDLLKQYIDENIVNNGIEVPEGTYKAIPEVSELLHKRALVGRDIESLTYEIMQKASAANQTTLTPQRFAEWANELSENVELKDIAPSPSTVPHYANTRPTAAIAA